MKKSIIAFMLLTLGVTGVAVAKKKDEAPFNFSKDGSYFIGAVNVKLTGTKKTNDKEETYNSNDVLTAELLSAITNFMQEKGKLAQDEGSAQATLDIEVTYQRNCVAMTSQRMPPIMLYKITAKKDGKVVGSYSSPQLISKDNPYGRVSNAQELNYIQSIAATIGDMILNSEK